jgi:hypothetical protein
MNAIDKPEIRLSAGPKVGNEAGIIDPGLAEGGSAHLAPLKGRR